MQIDVVSFGQTRNKHYAALCQDYMKRLGRYGKFASHELKEAKNQDTTVLLRDEADRMRQWVKKNATGALCVAMDERGKSWTSVKLSESIEEWMVYGQRRIVFFIGSANGLDPQFRKECDMRLALSAMTLPHEMAKTMLFEQLYRAMTILRGEPYHK